MGNYLASLPYINYGYQPENNNEMDADIAVHEKQPKVVPKLSNYLNAVDVSSVLAINRLQNECKKESSVVMKIWNRLNNLYTFGPGTKVISDENSQIDSLTPTCERSFRKKCGAESDFITFKFNSTTISQKDCFKRSQNRPPANFLFQRSDSGFEDTPYIKTHSTQIDLDSLYLTTVIKMVDNRRNCLFKEDLRDTVNGTNEYHKSISFFIDIRDPLKQKPLCEEYNFSACSECDSVLSGECCGESSDENCFDDDFIVFEEHCFEEEDGYGFNLTLNACTPTELSCSVRANSTVTTYFDISMNTSPNSSANTSCRNSGQKTNKESTVSMKVDFLASCDSKTSYESTATPNSSNSGEIILPKDVSTSEAASENTPKTSTNCFFSCPTNEKKSRKKVCFQKDEDLVVVYQMRHWDFAYRKARKGSWELAAVDRCRFWRRINELESILSPCLRRKLELIQKT